MATWKPHPDLIQLHDWFKGFKRLRARYQGGTGPLDPGLVQRAEAASQEFFAEAYVPTLIHGDLHHFNILSSERSWLAIDPKGVIGPAAYEVGPLLTNPWVVRGLPPEAAQLTAREFQFSRNAWELKGSASASGAWRTLCSLPGGRSKLAASGKPPWPWQASSRRCSAAIIHSAPKFTA